MCLMGHVDTDIEYCTRDPTLNPVVDCDSMVGKGEGGSLKSNRLYFVCVFEFIFLAELSEKRAIVIALKVKYIKLFATIINAIKIKNKIKELKYLTNINKTFRKKNVVHFLYICAQSHICFWF